MQISNQRSGLCAGGQCCSVQPGLLKPNEVTKVENTHIDGTKLVEPDMLLGYALKMKDAFHLAHLHKTCKHQCILSRLQLSIYKFFDFTKTSVISFFSNQYSTCLNLSTSNLLAAS